MPACTERRQASGHIEGCASGSKTMGDPPFMLAISVFEAMRDAVGTVKPAVVPVLMTAPAMAENVLRALG